MVRWVQHHARCIRKRADNRYWSCATWKTWKVCVIQAYRNHRKVVYKSLITADATALGSSTYESSAAAGLLLSWAAQNVMHAFISSAELIMPWPLLGTVCSLTSQPADLRTSTVLQGQKTSHLRWENKREKRTERENKKINICIAQSH